MKQEEWRLFLANLRKLPRKSLHELSGTTHEENRTFCVPDSIFGKKKAVDFDGFKDSRYSSGNNRPCSMDALFLPRETSQILYGIEFKTGDVEAINLVRKIYDTVICLWEHVEPKCDFRWSRASLEAVVVAPEEEISKARRNRFNKQSNEIRVINRPYYFPKKHAGSRRESPLWGLKDLQAVVVRRVYTLSPSEFEQFAIEHRWYNPRK